MLLTLLYHDITDRGREDTSGFPGAGAARYKLTPADFLAHLRAIASVVPGRPVTVHEALAGPEGGTQLLLTFDDGGASACPAIADALEERGWRGHFFITTDYLGDPAFVTPEQVRALRRRGHVIGSHSCSHPERMSACGAGELQREWQQSCTVLADLLGERVTVASVPGGFYSRAVAETAEQAGIEVLFTSEPTTRTRTVGSCLVLGRYAVYRGMQPGAAAALASGRRLPRLRQRLWWDVKKAAKAVGGRAYLRLRERLLARAYSTPDEDRRGIGAGRDSAGAASPERPVRTTP